MEHNLTSNNIKERIITTTTSLIKESDGFIENVTLRKIAKMLMSQLDLLIIILNQKKT